MRRRARRRTSTLQSSPRDEEELNGLGYHAAAADAGRSRGRKKARRKKVARKKAARQESGRRKKATQGRPQEEGRSRKKGRQEGRRKKAGRKKVREEGRRKKAVRRKVARKKAVGARRPAARRPRKADARKPRRKKVAAQKEVAPASRNDRRERSLRRSLFFMRPASRRARGSESGALPPCSSTQWHAAKWPGCVLFEAPALRRCSARTRSGSACGSGSPTAD